MRKSRWVVYCQVIAALGAIAAIAAFAQFAPVVDFLDALQQRVAGWGFWSGLCYPLLFALCNILLLPGGILAVGGGFFFGLWWGFLVVFAGNFIAAAVSFGLSRSVAGRWFRRKLAGSPTLRALEPAVQHEGWKIVLLSQLHPLFPTSLLNYIYGMTRIPLRQYLFWASLGRVPGLFLYVYIGTLGQLGLRIIRGKSYPQMVEYWTWGGALVTTALLLFVLGRVALRAVRAENINDLKGAHKEGRSTDVKHISSC
jgi:uncharacterized membrane protein YdjX (TVP38/TMEM64 family)